MQCELSPLHTRQPYRFVVILSFCGEQLVLSRHKQRTTYETQGGHIEPGETPEQAARRELWEEWRKFVFLTHCRRTSPIPILLPNSMNLP